MMLFLLHGVAKRCEWYDHDLGVSLSRDEVRNVFDTL